jgi:ferritin-like metal-binding protein YciE
MFEKLDTPEEVFSFKLGAALKMENKVLEMLGELQEQTHRDEIRQLLAKHAGETREHIANIERSFELLGEEPDDSPCPAIEGIEKEGKANVKKADDAVIDDVLLSGAAETEHHEIAVYEGLITHAQAMRKGDVVELLKQNLEQEQHTLEEVKQATEKAAAASSGAPSA